MVFEGWKGPMAVLLGLGAGSSRRRGRGVWGVKPISPGFLLHSWKGEACWQGYPGDLGPLLSATLLQGSTAGLGWGP